MTKLLSSTVCDKIFDYLPLFDETVRHKELCNIQIASSVKYSEIRQNFSNSVEAKAKYSATLIKIG